MLSGLAVADLIAAIGGGDVDRLVRIPGVGRKTAERIILELREKLPAAPADADVSPDPDVLSALINLGCARPAAEAAVRKAKLEGAAGFEPLFRRALELLR